MPHKDPGVAKTYHANYRAKNRERRISQQKAWYERKQGENKKQYNRRFVSQKWDRMFGWKPGTHARLIASATVCDVCGEPLSSEFRLRPTTDHDHRTGMFRGIVHHKCNISISFVDEKIDYFLKILAYLERTSEI